MRRYLSGRAIVALVLLCAAVAQAHAAGPRIGLLSPTTPEGSAFVLAALREGLREQGYADGNNVTIVARYANDRFDRLPDLARELVSLPVDVIVAYVTQASLAAKRSTRTIPIVMLGVSDPVASGLVSSLSRPGGNVTGTSAPFAGSAGKGLQMLKEVVPGLQRVGVLWNPANAVFQAQVLEETRVAARSLGIELELFEAGGPEAIDSAFAAMAKQRVAAVSVLPDPVFGANWRRIAGLAVKLRLPSVTVSSTYAEAGGLMAYGPSLQAMARIAGSYAGRILKGANPAELPVEMATKFELVINAGTAKRLGVSLPPSLLLRADRMIQ